MRAHASHYFESVIDRKGIAINVSSGDSSSNQVIQIGLKSVLQNVKMTGSRMMEAPSVNQL